MLIFERYSASLNLFDAPTTTTNSSIYLRRHYFFYLKQEDG
jgi:hypothetical protein